MLEIFVGRKTVFNKHRKFFWSS